METIARRLALHLVAVALFESSSCRGDVLSHGTTVGPGYHRQEGLRKLIWEEQKFWILLSASQIIIRCITKGMSFATLSYWRTKPRLVFFSFPVELTYESDNSENLLHCLSALGSCSASHPYTLASGNRCCRVPRRLDDPSRNPFCDGDVIQAEDPPECCTDHQLCQGGKAICEEGRMKSLSLAYLHNCSKHDRDKRFHLRAENLPLLFFAKMASRIESGISDS